MIEESQQRGSMAGVYPQIGDLARLTTSANLLYRDAVWFRVLDVRPSSLPDYVYLHGYHAEEDRRIVRTVFVRTAGLVIRRGE